MDVLADVLDALELRGILCSRTEIPAPWRFRFAASADAIFHVINFGGGYLLVEGEPSPILVADGDVVVLPHGHGHDLCDDPHSPITKNARMEYGDGTHAGIQVYPFEGQEPKTVLLCGLFHLARPREYPLLDLLPTVIRIPGEGGRAADGLPATLDLLARESKAQRPGAEALLQRLVEMLFIQVVRAWAEEQPHGSGGWLSALRDPQIGSALDLLHRERTQRWTVEMLAGAVSLSRSAFASRFTTLVGAPPIAYLTRLRLRTAARQLRAGADVRTVAGAAGYESEVAFRKAFARELGVAPGRYRRSGTPSNGRDLTSVRAT